MSRKLSLFILVLVFVVIAAGCNIEEPIDPDQGGFWDRFFVYPLAWLMDFFAEQLNPTADPEENRYGWAIVIVTILLRLLVLPLMIKQIKTSRIMQELQPEMQKLQKKYQKNQEKLQQETMKLFQKYDVNPLAGCLPILVQMPILIAFYHAIYRHDLIRNYEFFGIALGDPFWGLAILAGVTTYLQQKMMGTQANPQMQILIVIMPIMITVFAFIFPAALSLYWVIGNLFTIVQTYFMKDMYKVEQGAAKK